MKKLSQLSGKVVTTILVKKNVSLKTKKDQMIWLGLWARLQYMFYIDFIPRLIFNKKLIKKNNKNKNKKLWLSLTYAAEVSFYWFVLAVHETDVIRQLFALGRSQWGQIGDFRLLERTFSIYWMNLAKNGKISLKGILLFWV